MIWRGMFLSGIVFYKNKKGSCVWLRMPIHNLLLYQLDIIQIILMLKF